MKTEYESTMCSIRDKEWFRYLLTGGGAVFVDFAGYFLLTGIDIIPSIAKGSSYVAGALFAFSVNKSWTFRSQGKIQGELCKFAGLYVFTFVANVFLNDALLWATELKLFAFIVATGTTIVLNYIGQKYWVFGRIPK